ncbi:hypothetical protein BBJ28_00023625 [Nothophytophthora sp. Chile5]|nr:hypothetical protein BBJ28_00023625 [Nothophytophthora sp. Chile5]
MSGTTSFASSPSSSYRFVVSLKDEKVNIWLEDRSSKKQWKTDFLSKEDYVTSANAFLDAAPKVYALVRPLSYAARALDGALDEAEDAQRKLTPLSDDKLRLEMSANIRMLQLVRRVTYTFELHPVAMERIDILEAKLRDLQEALETSRETIWLHHESEGDLSESPGKILWKPLDSESFQVVEDQSAVQWLFSGVYSIGVVVNHAPDAETGALELQQNGVVIQRVCINGIKDSSDLSDCDDTNESVEDSSDCEDVDEATNSSLLCVTKVAKGDNFAVTCSGTSFVAVSYLTVVRIGN